MTRSTLGYLLAFGSAATGAVRYNLARFAEGRGFDPVAFLACALVVGTACCTTHVLVRDGASGFRPLRGQTRYALLYAVLMAWSGLSHFLALRYLDETLMSSLAQTNILFVIAFAVVWLGERFTRAEWLGTGLVLAGLLLFRPWTGEEARLTGFLVVLSGVLASSVATVGARRWVRDIPPRLLMTWRNGVALVGVGAFALLDGAPFALGPATLIACAVAGVVGPYLHGLFFLQALERLEAAKAALVGRVQPAIVFLLSWAFLSRMPSASDLLSSALLVFGTLWLVAARPRGPARA